MNDIINRLFIPINPFVCQMLIKEEEEKFFWIIECLNKIFQRKKKNLILIGWHFVGIFSWSWSIVVTISLFDGYYVKYFSTVLFIERKRSVSIKIDQISKWEKRKEIFDLKLIFLLNYKNPFDNNIHNYLMNRHNQYTLMHPIVHMYWYIDVSIQLEKNQFFLFQNWNDN